MTNDNATSREGADVEKPGARIEDVAGRMAAIETARRALMSRKPFSVKNQIYVANGLVFLFFLVMAVVLISSSYRVRSRIEFLEFVNEFTVEIQQARRYEKNFFLYGTNLEDALENVQSARIIFTDNADQFASILTPTQQKTVLDQLGAYTDLLLQLQQTMRMRSSGIEEELLTTFETKLRGHGKDLVDSAQSLMKKERVALNKNLQQSRDINLYSLVALLVLLVINAYLLVSRILFILPRFSAYAKRIAGGDFTPITPQRRFRDEFTELALAINEMIREIADRELALVQTHKMRAIGTLTAGVAHELNNPMNNIMLTAHMLVEDYAQLSDEERLDMVGDVIEETGRAKRIVSNLLDFARESDSMFQPLNLAKLLNDTVRLAENQVRMAGIRLQLTVADGLPEISGDSQKLQQVFLNLILNAVDASPKGSIIQMDAQVHSEPDKIAIQIIDHGTGIPKDHLSSIFDPFFTTKAQGKGTGLGLSVSQGIVAKHGGGILVDSEEGRGTVFTVVLPVHSGS